jgi:hypothetical protein
LIPQDKVVAGIKTDYKWEGVIPRKFLKKEEAA